MSEIKKDPKQTEPTFESAMERLDAIVEQMEANKLPLEDLLRGYEEGLKLVKFCSEKLDSAEKRIQIITREAMGKPQVVEFEPQAPQQEKKTPPPSRSEDISLF